MSSLMDSTFKLYSIKVFSTDYPLSHWSALLKQIANYEKNLKTTASPSQKTNPEQPKRLYTLSYLLQDDNKQIKNDKGYQVEAGQQKQMKSPRKPSSCPSSKRRPRATVTHKVRDKKMKNNPTPPDGFLPNAAAPAVTNVAGNGIPLNQQDSLSDDFAKDGLSRKPGSNSPGGGAKNSSVSVGDPKVPVVPSTGVVPKEVPMSAALAQKINNDIKHQLMKEVRKFGRRYERIFTLFEEVQGPLVVKKQFVEFTIKEAARFKRAVLIQQLEKVLENLESCCHLKNVNHKKSRELCSCKDQ
ncbi:integrator complex subunit 6-like [Panthera pardus]|uniref:Integrator complex subunit 6-like n=1 Tax=Panthera pardus TaxID=9691 RepID=A0A9V1F4A9_PANPR|nr:integrator complex subunit 6-like [Panthera pardus]